MVGSGIAANVPEGNGIEYFMFMLLLLICCIEFEYLTNVAEVEDFFT